MNKATYCVGTDIGQPLYVSHLLPEIRVESPKPASINKSLSKKQVGIKHYNMQHK